MTTETTSSKGLSSCVNPLVDVESVFLHPDIIEKILSHIHGKDELLNLRITCKALKSAVDKLPQLEEALSKTWVTLTEQNYQRFLDEMNTLPVTAFKLNFSKDLDFPRSIELKPFLDKYGMKLHNLEMRESNQCGYISEFYFHQHEKQRLLRLWGMGYFAARESAGNYRESDGSLGQDLFYVSHRFDKLDAHNCKFTPTLLRDRLCCSLVFCINKVPR